MACSHRQRVDKTRQFCLVHVGGVNKPLRIPVQSSTALPWASRPRRRPAWPASTPLCQHRPSGTLLVRRSDLSAAESFRSLHLVHGTICQLANYCYICSVITLSPAPSILIFFNLVHLGHYKKFRLD